MERTTPGPLGHKGILLRLVFGVLCLQRGGGSGLLLAASCPPTTGGGLVGGLEVEHQAVILGEVDAGDVPALVRAPATHLAEQVNNGRSGDANLALLPLALAELGGVGRVRLADADGKLLLLLQDEELDVGGVVQFNGGLVVELDGVPGDGDNGIRAGANEVNDQFYDVLCLHGKL